MIKSKDQYENFQAPFPYFGGKRMVAGEVWQRFGDPKNYIEPFFGSGAVMLARSPWGEHRVETVNDKNAFLANFWRAVQHDPEAVAEHADWPVNETDLHARHRWLMGFGHGHVAQLLDDPDYYDAKIAGWWVWGASMWIGGGWCDEKALRKGAKGEHTKGTPKELLPDLGWAKGINSQRVAGTPKEVRPALCRGFGVHSQRVAGTPEVRPHLSTAGQRPHLSDAGQGVSSQRAKNLTEHFMLLSQRFRQVRVCCGDWKRICGPCPTFAHGLTGVFLDPPYAAEADRDQEIYAEEDLQVAHEVREWAIEQGRNPLMRIALCGYEGEHKMPDNWKEFSWKAHGGYASTAKHTDRGAKNRSRERIWFSPHCLRPNQPTLFGQLEPEDLGEPEDLEE